MSFLSRRKKTEHRWVEESLSAYMDGELSPADRARVEEHLQRCKSCTQNLRTLQHTVRLVRELPAMSAPRSFAVRPAVTRARPVRAAPSWGYGVLKGATAIAALLLMLLIGGDLAWHVVGTPLTPMAPAAQAPEVAWAPSPEPSVAPSAAEEETMLGQAKETEPSDLEQMVPAPGEPTQPADGYTAPPAEVSPPAKLEATAPAGTPTSGAQPTEIPEEEGAPLGAGGAEPTPSAESAPPATAERPVEGPSMLATPAPPETDRQRAAVAPGSPTPEIVAMAEEATRDEAQQTAARQLAMVFALSPLRLAELMVLVVLVVLAAATALTAWLRRRAS